MTKYKCEHCQLIYDENVLIKEKNEEALHYFCCKGCQGIYHLLKSEGLDSFYDKLGKQTIAPPLQVSKDLEKFDLEGFKTRYINETIDGFSQISLIIEGIHCAACVWLNEKVLHQKDGIIEASINGTNHKAKVVWDPESISLSQIIETIRSIGYNAHPYDPSLQEAHANATRREYYARLLVGVFTTMNIMWLAVAKYAGYFTGMRLDIKHILNFAEFSLATPALFYTGWVFYRGAYYGLKNRHINMDTLVATGASLAYIFSIYAMFTGNGETYFDSVTMIITFVFAGKYLEVLTKKRAIDTLDSMSGSLPTEVTIIHKNEKILMGVDEVQVGDTIELRPGEKVVIDGLVKSGEASFDMSSLTGESEPRLLTPKDEILSGSICLDGVVRYEASQNYKGSMLSKIMTLLEESMTKKPRIEQLANIISGYFSITVLSIALIAFLGWFFATNSFETALIISISVIVIACPCALGLATPVSTLVGLGVGAKRGIVFKEAGFIENMAKANVLLIDKTGTLTEGKPQVNKAWIDEFCDKEALIALLESSTHPVSKGVLAYIKSEHKDIKSSDIDNIKVVEAKGVRATKKGTILLGGSTRLLEENGVTHEVPKGTHYLMAQNGKIVASFTLEDKPKANAFDILARLKKRGIRIVMLTGDNKTAAFNLAKKVGIDEVHHSLLPHEKAQIVKEFHAKKKRVIMVGDGINDTLALSQSDVAIAMGSGADIAINTSDVVLLSGSLESLEEAILIAKRTYRTIQQNIGFSLIYNTFTIPLAVAGYVIPLFAALSMSLSSLVVIGNAMRIRSKGGRYEW